MRKTELLAPAGSLESLKAAVNAGADAVYIGGTKFGARAYANNLTEEDMKWAIDYAHLHGVALYMTINTLLKEKELEMKKILKCQEFVLFVEQKLLEKKEKLQ